MEKEKQTLTTHFIKSPEFCSHYVSGIFGGVTPTGQINMCHFIERVVLPKSIQYSVENNNIQEIGRDSISGMVRETQGSLVFDIHQAKSIVQWLNEKIQIIETQNQIKV